jgi:hypothetical protein
VTGAASGLGRQLALRLADAGAKVIAIDRDEVDPAKGVQSLRVDLADRAEVDRLLRNLDTDPPFDWIIHNAAVSATGNFERIPEATYLRLLTLNCETPMVMTAHMLAAGKIAPGGRLVFISSLSHSTGYPGGAVYGASKDALAIYAKSIRAGLSRQGFKVTTVFPGPVRTDHAARHAPPEARAERRMDPDVLAGKIIRAAGLGKSVLYPGLPAKTGRIVGAVMPRRATRFIRRAIFEKLERDVY